MSSVAKDFDLEEELPLKSSSDKDEPPTTPTWPKKIARQGMNLVLLIGVVGLLGLVANTLLHSPTPRRTSHTTVRRLMESPELTQLMAQNYLSLRGETQRQSDVEDVRASVSRNLQDFCGMMLTEDPTAHDNLAKIEVNPATQEDVFVALRHYGGAWGQQMVYDIADTLHHDLQMGSTRHRLQQNLLLKLRPRMKQLRDSLDQAQAHALQDDDNLNLEEMGLGDFEKWHLHFDMSPVQTSGNDASSHRPADTRITSNKTEGLTLAQLMLVFGQIDNTLKREPQASIPARRLLAPARQLLFEKKKAEMAKSTGKERFMKCVQALLNDHSPKKFALCLSEHCPLLWAWLSKKFLSLTGKPLTIPK